MQDLSFDILIEARIQCRSRKHWRSAYYTIFLQSYRADRSLTWSVFLFATFDLRNSDPPPKRIRNRDIDMTTLTTCTKFHETTQHQTNTHQKKMYKNTHTHTHITKKPVGFMKMFKCPQSPRLTFLTWHLNLLREVCSGESVQVLANLLFLFQEGLYSGKPT